jgi:RNA polymerase sigma factor (sigma-70 family)
MTSRGSILDPGFLVQQSSAMEPTDTQLLLACAAGDEAAWELLIERYQRLIYTIPRRAGLDENQTAEVFQDVFATLVDKLKEIEQPERLQAWLVTTARRKTWRVLLRDHKHTSSSYDESVEREAASVADPAPLPDELLLKLEEQHQVRTAVKAMDPRCRELLSLLFYSSEPLSYLEIARILKTTEGSIGPTRARCLKKLLRLIAK